jgi:thymidylate synthase
MTIWRQSPDEIYPESKDIPCTVMLHFMIRNFKLNLTVYMRSNDAWLGLPYDLFNFTQIQCQVAVKLGYPPGNYYHIAGSMHVYTHNTADAHWMDKYPGHEITLPLMSPNDLDILAEFEEDLRTDGHDILPERCSHYVDVHARLLVAYHHQKAGIVGHFKMDYPEPYASLIKEARLVRAKFKDSEESVGLGSNALNDKGV